MDRCFVFKRQPHRDIGWDLDLVLRDLAQLTDPPSPLQLVYKALFLVAFLAGTRVSELAALRFPLCFSDRGVSIPFDSVFIPERTRALVAHNALPPIHVLALSLPDECTCPVAALRCYASSLQSTEPGSPLWRHPTRSVAVTSRHLSAWLRATIAAPYRRTGQANLAGFAPHSIRAAAASWAWKGNVPLATILSQCRGSRESSFSTFYLRRLTESDGTAQRLKPLAAASLL
jgi:integrase